MSSACWRARGSAQYPAPSGTVASSPPPPEALPLPLCAALDAAATSSTESEARSRGRRNSNCSTDARSALSSARCASRASASSATSRASPSADAPRRSRRASSSLSTARRQSSPLPSPLSRSTVRRSRGAGGGHRARAHRMPESAARGARGVARRAHLSRSSSTAFFRRSARASASHADACSAASVAADSASAARAAALLSQIRCALVRFATCTGRGFCLGPPYPAPSRADPSADRAMRADQRLGLREVSEQLVAVRARGAQLAPEAALELFLLRRARLRLGALPLQQRLRGLLVQTLSETSSAVKIWQGSCGAQPCRWGPGGVPRSKLLWFWFISGQLWEPDFDQSGQGRETARSNPISQRMGVKGRAFWAREAAASCPESE
jgi:hypothetical protein